jgi:hypothetical protein
MPSPFPGMDPYLEDPAVWEGFHTAFIVECMYLLSQRLPRNYVANINERVRLISITDEAAREYVPDVSLARLSAANQRRPQSGGGGTAVAAAPVVLPDLDSLEVRDGYIEIIRFPEQELVTSIELLSPSNKFGEGIGEYRGKRTSHVRTGVHFVEIDLLVRGRRTQLARPLPPGDYFAFVFRADRRPDVDVYAWGVRNPLPVVSVPLRNPDPDVQLDLATVVNNAYDRGLYVRKLRYGGPVPAPLAPGDATWAAEVAKRAADTAD